jgi:hypothetical protein
VTPLVVELVRAAAALLCLASWIAVFLGTRAVWEALR